MQNQTIYRYWEPTGKAKIVIDQTTPPCFYPELQEVMELIQTEPRAAQKHWFFGFTSSQVRKAHKKIFSVPHWKKYFFEEKSSKLSKEKIPSRNIFSFKDQVLFYSLKGDPTT